MNNQQAYDQLITLALLEQRQKGEGVYYERHHIFPRCLGGSDSERNLVLLTAEEHCEAHRLLAEIYPGHLGLVLAGNWLAPSPETHSMQEDN